MKLLIFVFLGLLQLSLSDKEYAENLKLDLPEGFIKNLAKDYFAVREDSGAITAIVNDYADTILRNIGNFTHKYGLDPLPVDGFDQAFLTEHLTLANGTINGIGTIKRGGNVNLTYSPTSNVLDLILPIEFSNLYFEYHFTLILLLIGPTGNVTGKIDNFKMDLELAFDLNSFQAAINKISTTDTGSVSLIFTADGLIEAILDLVIDIISQFVTLILHPFIVGVIQGIVEDVAKMIVTTVNDLLNDILNPSNSTNTTTLLTKFVEEHVYKLPIS